jgi:hypothetical protein
VKNCIALAALALVSVACDRTTAVLVSPSITPLVLPTLPTPGGPASPILPSQCRIRGALPDLNCTPGAINTAVTQSTMNTTI